MKYIESLTERKLPPTREIVQIYASDIARHPVSESWVTRFLHQHQDKLTSQWSTSIDRKRTLLIRVISTRCTSNSWAAKSISTKWSLSIHTIWTRKAL
jgi:hypothetical protein